MSSTDCLARFRRSSNPSPSATTAAAQDYLERCVAVEVLTEVITSRKQAQGEAFTPATFPSPVEYFAACMSVLDASSSSTTNARERVHFLFLLTALLPQVPAGVLRRKSDECLKILVRLLAAGRSTKDPAVAALSTRYAVSSIAVILQAEERTKSAWARPVVVKAFHGLVECLAHAKPKVRKAAQQAVVELLRQVGPLQAPHRLVVEVCLEVLQACSLADATQTMQLLAFLRPALPVLRCGVHKLIGEVLRLAQLGHKDLALYSLMTLQCYYAEDDQRLELRALAQQVQGLGGMATSNVKLVSRDGQVCKYWSEALRLAFRSIYRRGGAGGDELLATVIAALVKLACSCEEPSLVVFPTEQLKLLVKECVETEAQARATLPCLDPLLLPRMQPHWNQTLSVFIELFRTVSGEQALFLSPLLKKMVTLRESAVNPITGADKDIDLPWRRPVENLILAALDSLGVELFLEQVPLSGSEKRGVSASRAWLIPLLKRGIGSTRTRLEYFQTKVLKLAAECEACSEETARGSDAAAKMHLTRAMQLWDLFPEFARNCTDISSQGGFSTLAPVLAAALKEHKYATLPRTICAGMQALIEGANESDRKVIASSANMLLPLLFNQYSAFFEAGKQEQAQVTHELIAAYAGIAEEGVVNALFKQLLKQMLLAMRAKTLGKAAEPRVLCSLSLALIPSLKADCIDLLYRGIRPLVESQEDSLLQKSGYKVLEALCQHQEQWVLAHREELSTLMRTSLLTASANAKTGRLRCLASIVAATKSEDKLGKEEMDGIAAEMLGEVMLCTKESNNKARMAAFKLLVAIGECLEAVYLRNGAAVHEGSKRFVYIVVAGLAAETPHMRSATLVSLSRVFTHYGKVEELQELLVEVARTSLLLLKEKSREVAKSGIGFAKVCAVRLTKESSGLLLPDIVTALLPWANDSKNRFSLKIRVIFERLIKRLGQDVVESCPAIPKDHKILVYIKKQAAYKARKYERGQKMRKGEQETGHLEQRSQARRPKRKREEGDGMVMDEREGQLDLLDSSALGKVHVDSMKTQDSGDESDDSVIQFTKDGKLLLLEDDIDDGDKADSDSDMMSDEEDDSDSERRQAKQRAKDKAKAREESSANAKKARIAQR